MNGKGRGPEKGYNRQAYAANYDAIFRRKGTQQNTQPMKTPEQEQPNQPAVLPWHREAAQRYREEYTMMENVYDGHMPCPDLAAIIARHDPAPLSLVEKKIAHLQARHAETLRLLEDADNVLCDVSRYPIASVYPDGPCLERETHDNVCKLLIRIRAHLAAQKGTR